MSPRLHFTKLPVYTVPSGNVTTLALTSSRSMQVLGAFLKRLPYPKCYVLNWAIKVGWWGERRVTWRQVSDRVVQQQEGQYAGNRTAQETLASPSSQHDTVSAPWLCASSSSPT